jgi:hypothetical protein
MLNLLLALALGGAALAVLGYLIALLAGALGAPVGGYLERWRFAQHVARAQRADGLLQQGRAEEALPLLLRSFHLTTFRRQAMASAVANHHTGLLSRLIALTSESQGGTVRLLSLAKTDKLLAERAALQKRFITLAQDGSAQKRRDVRQQLEANRRELQSALAKLIEEVRAARKAETRYH